MDGDLTWETLDWSALDRLRVQFLGGVPRGPYWNTRSDLANYDFTFGRRIAWKWDAVLRELRLRHWTPPTRDVFDWGCGSGIASRAVIGFFGPDLFHTLRLYDQSALAIEFATEFARKTFSALRIEPAPSDWLKNREPLGLLVVSHVLNELTAAGQRTLRDLMYRAAAVLWVEPGTRETTRTVMAWRDEMRGSFDVVAPCTHQAACGLRATENERHWCHHFAAPPAGIMGDSNWVRFAQRAGIDLRSLPYTFLVLERKGLREPVPGLLPARWSRLIGEPRCYKGYAKILSCQDDGVCELRLQKRAQPDLFRALKDGDAGLLHCWRRQGREIQAGEALKR